MLIVVRHGHTAFNDNGSEKLRGWLPIPLTLDGVEDVEKTADQLKSLVGVDHIYCSDLPRTVQTAQIIASELKQVIEPVIELRDWDIGRWVGKDAKSMLPEFWHHMEHPKEPIPGGENYEDFLARCIPFLTKMQESKEFNIIVTHARICTMIKAMEKSKGKELDVEILEKKCPIDPAGFMILTKPYKIDYMTPRKPGEEVERKK